MSAAVLQRDPRVASAIATRGEVASLVRVRPERLTSWAHPTGGRAPLVHTIRGGSRFTVPLVGIAEAASLNALRQSGLSMQQARAAAEYIRAEHRDEYALASPRLLTDGTDAFIQDDDGLVRLRDKQGAIREVIADHLRPLIIGPDGLVEAFRVEEFTTSEVTVDPRYNAGRISFVRNRVPVFAVAGALTAGESNDVVATDFGLDHAEIEQVRSLLDWLATVT
jgi:uncharacterized protein (DUF433 family)